MQTPTYFLLNATSLDFSQFLGRYIAFPIARSKSGKYFLATCAHSIRNNGGLHAFQFLYPDGTQLPKSDPSDPPKNYIFPPESGLDLAIVEISLDREVSIPRFKEGRIPRGAEISHVRNVSGREEFDGNWSISTAIASETGEKFLSHQDQLVDVKELRTAQGQIPTGTHRGLLMQSWPGVSGSPLWDKFGNVRGMVAGGNEQLTVRYPEYFLCFLPIEEIMKNLKKFLGSELP